MVKGHEDVGRSPLFFGGGPLKKSAVLCFFLILSLFIAAKTYIVTLPYVILNEAMTEPLLVQFINSSSFALLNVQSKNTGRLSSAYATLGAKVRAAGFSEEIGVKVYKPNQLYDEGSALAIYKQRTGLVPEEDGLLLVDIEALKNLNEDQYYEITPGLMASTLRLKGKTTAYIGNTNTLEEPRNPGALGVIDRCGFIAEGENIDILCQNLEKPFGFEADLTKIIFLALKSQAEVVLIEMGDVERIEAEAFYLSLDSYNKHRKAALRKTAQLLLQLQVSLLKEDTIILLSVLPDKLSKKEGYGLGFLAIWQNQKEAALLYSPTTRRVGLVALTDIAPTIEYYAGFEKALFQGGSVLEKVPKKRDSLVKLLDEDRISALIKKIRPIFFRLYISLLIGTIGGAFLCIVAFPFKKWLNFLQILLFSEAILPLFLLSPALVTAKYYLPVFFLGITLAFVLGFINYQKKQTLWPIIVISVLFILTLELIFSASLIPRSVFGYDYQAGARFYGIGNEYMGYLIGAVLLCLYYLGLVKKRPLTGLVLVAFYMLVIAYPLLGANVGGGLTMLILLFAWLKIGAKKKLFTPYLLFLPLFFLLWVVADYLRGGSHLIRTILAIKDDGIKVMLDVIMRKASMNLKLWQYSLWSRGLIAFVVGLLWLVYRPVESLRLYLGQAVGLRKLLILTIITAFFAVISNDSGVVAGALVFLIPGCFLLSALLGSVSENG